MSLVSMDFDDFSPLNHRFDLIAMIQNRYPDFKVTMFTIPWDIRISTSKKGTPITEPEYRPWVNAVKQAVDAGWMEVAIHGLTHAPEEYAQLTYTQAKNRLLVATKMFDNVGIKTNGMFKAPQWLISEGAKQAVKDMGLTLMEDGYYTWNLKDDKPKKQKLIAHGHIQDERSTNNGMEQSLVRIFQIPKNARWCHVREMI